MVDLGKEGQEILVEEEPATIPIKEPSPSREPVPA